jgi:hypothetical protein
MTKKLKYISKHIKRYPKITATIVFAIIVLFLSFLWGYRLDKNKKDKPYTTTHHFWNGVKWTVIIFAVLTVFSSMIALIFNTNFFQFYLFGGDMINLTGQIIIALLSLLNN